MTTFGVSGGLSVDHLVTVDQAPHYRCLGGPGLYASLAAALVPGVTVRLSSMIPTDTGRFAATFEAAGVDITHSAASAAAPTLWILNSPEGRRLVSTIAPTASVEIADDDELDIFEHPLPASFLDGLDGLLLCAPRRLELPARIPIVGIDPDQEEATTSGNPHWDTLSGDGRVLLPSRVQLRALDLDVHAAARQLAERLDIPVVARLDVDGVYLVDNANGGCWRIQDCDVDVVDTTGAGDAMAGATLAALTTGMPLPEAAALGVSAARLTLSSWAHAGLVAGPGRAGPTPLAVALPGVIVTKE